MNPIHPNDWQLAGSGGMTDAQRRLLNAACGDLAAHLPWHGGVRLTKDDYRHMIAGTLLGWRTMPGIDRGEGQHGWIMLGGSSLDLSRASSGPRRSSCCGFSRTTMQTLRVTLRPTRWRIGLRRWASPLRSTCRQR